MFSYAKIRFKLEPDFLLPAVDGDFANAMGW